MKMQLDTMKYFSRSMQIFSLILVLLISFSIDAEAQRRGKKKTRKSETDEYFDESGVGAHRFWYGGGLGLGFSGGNIRSRFDISLSPMMGYKITPEFSIGPRVELSYTHYRQNISFNNVFKTNLFNYGIGVFSRYKVFNQFFGHVEYQVESRQDPVGFNGDKIRTRFNNFYLGAGYTSGGLVGYEISLLYNVLEDDNTVDLPIDFRVAFTYNF
jgi:hypothetical protein